MAVALRLAWLFQPMRYDESITFLDTASNGFWAAWSQYGPNNHVLHTLLVRFCTLWTSREWAIRLPAFAAGALTPWVIYLVGRQLFDRWAGLFGAAMVACAPHLIEYSTNARGYSMVGLFALLQIMLADRVVRTAGHRELLLFAIITALGFLTIPTMLYPTAATVVWTGLVAISRRAETPWRALRCRVPVYAAIGIGLMLLLYGPVLWQKDGWHNLTGNRWVAPLDSYGSWLRALKGLFSGLWAEWSLGLTTPGLAVVIALAAGAVLVRLRRRDARAAWVAVTLVICLSLMAVQRVVPFVRVFGFALPVLLMTAGAGLAALLKNWPPFRQTLLAIGLCACLAIYTAAARLPDRASAFDKFPPAAEVMAFLSPHIDAGDAVAFGVVPGAPVRYARFRTGRPPLVYRPGARRLWLVLRDDDSIEKSLTFNRLRAIDFKPPVLAYKKGIARIYVLVPLAGRTPRQHRAPATGNQ